VEEAVRSYRAYLVKLDLLFPLIYGLLFAYIVIRLTGGKEQEPPDWAVALGALPLVAALVDYVENALHLALLRDVEDHRASSQPPRPVDSRCLRCQRTEVGIAA